MEVVLNNCPFCGQKAVAESRGMSCGNGEYRQDYWCGCKKCCIGFYGTSRFILSKSELKFIFDAYKDITEKWNMRSNNEIQA